MKRRWAQETKLLSPTPRFPPQIGRRKHWFTQADRADPRGAGAMSSPARSTVSAASWGAVSAAEDVADSIDALYRKDEAMAGDTPLSLVQALACECLRESE